MSTHDRIARAALTIGLLTATLASTGCLAPSRGPAVPRDLQEQAVVPGYTTAVRTWGSDFNPEFEQELLQTVHRERGAIRGLAPHAPLPPAYYLAISGGGPDGAFTAGLLKGWTETGTRPSFKAVTGISTGALIAPFAFLGPEYDDVLEKFYTETTTDDVLTPRSILAAIFDDALADTTPLHRMVAECVTQEVLDAIAAEHAKGRILIIGTTNLDARRAVLWNIGVIAASGRPDALDLVRNALIASAAIPAAFPPVMFDVTVDGQAYQEMHVDGGAMAQVFIYPPSFRPDQLPAGTGRERHVYVIRNSRLDPIWAETERHTLKIAGRAVASLIHTQGIGDLFRIYMYAQRDGLDFNLAYIPPDFTLESEEVFDPHYMKELFKVGYDLALNNDPWHDRPPYLDAEP